MNDWERAAVEYLTPPVYAFWAWSDGGDACEWRNGKTIAFRGEIEEVMRRLERCPLPPFGTILLLLAATRDRWQEGASELGIVTGLSEFLSGHQSTGLQGDTADRTGLATDLAFEAFSRLDAVHKLPAELRHSLRAKAEIVAWACEDAVPRRCTTVASDVLMVLGKELHTGIEQSARGELAQRLPPSEIKPSLAAKESWQSLRNCLHCLCQDTPLDPDQLRLRLQTGLDELPTPAPLELTPAEQAWALVQALQDDAELGGVARLARNLAAVVHLPKPIAQFEEMPLGGVSDITNRGPLDRLLLSELAHDELTLSVRVAMNEALYLRRESPPRSPPRERFVLLDAGLRTWGVPRVFATAIALALAASKDRQVATRAYRSADDNVAAVDFTSRAGLVAHLGELATAAHPAAALRALIDRVDPLPGTDTILITTADTLADPEFTRELASLELPALHVATVDRSGVFRLMLVSRQGHKILREARFDLDELLTPGRARPLVDRELQRGRPAIFSVEPFPLLLAQQFEIERFWLVAERGALSITRDQRLLHWTTANQGGRQITDKLPPGDLHWAATEADRSGIVRAVVGRLGQLGLSLLLIDLERESCSWRGLKLAQDSPRAVAGYQGVIYVIFDDHVEAFDATSGESCGHLSTTILQWMRGRFFRERAGQRWCALGFDGLSPKIVPFPSTLGGGRTIMSVFDCPGAEGPMAVNSQSVIASCSSATSFAVFDKPTWGAQVLAISRDGARVALQEKNLPTTHDAVVVDVNLRLRTPLVGNPQEAVEADLKCLVRARALRRRFSSIAVLVDGSLAISTGKRGWWRLSPSDSNNSLYLQHLQLGATSAAIQAFEDAQTPGDVGYSLRCATWKDGSKAFLDSRGLLHLRSSDTAIPEATIVLAEGQMAGWVADGRCWGAAYFLPSDAPRIEGREFVERVLKPFVSRIAC